MAVEKVKFRERPLAYTRMKAYWQYARFTAGRRTLPDFLVIGTQKGGTSSLNQYLRQHPDVASTFKKEVHYFDLNYSRGEGWYRAHLPLQRKMGAGQVTGDASPYYMFFPLAADRAFQLLPEAKLIVLLRDPVDRAYSHYNHNLRRGRESRSFEEAIKGEIERTALAEEGIIADPSISFVDHRHFSYLSRGLYARQLDRWLSRYDRDQALILSSEEFFASPRETYQQVTQFLGIRDWTPPEFKTWNAGKYPPMSADTRTDLSRMFAKPNQKLFQLIGQEFPWGGSAAG